METTIIKYKGKFYIKLNNMIPCWQSGFSCIQCAETFLRTHDITTATETHIKYSADDFEWIVDTYGFLPKKDNLWTARISNYFLTLKPDVENIVLTVNDSESTEVYDNLDDILQKLDDLYDDSILSSVQIIPVKYRRSILAASNARELASKMVRVKSSNIWSYTIDIKNAGDKTGDVLVQFKGKNGGPDDVYMYFDVPVVLWRKWLSAPSKGHFFHVYIRNNFTYRKLTGDRKTHLKNGIN